MSREPQLSDFIDKLKPDVEQLKYSNEFGFKIYNRLVKQYPDLGSGQLPKGKKKPYANKVVGGPGYKNKKPTSPKKGKPYGYGKPQQQQ